MADTNAEHGRPGEQQPASTKGRILAAKKAAKAAKKAAKRGRQAEVRETEAIRASTKVAEYLREQRKVLVGIVAALVLVGGGLAAYFITTGHRDREATALLTEGALTATAPLEGDPAEAAEVFTSVRSRAESTAERFGEAIAQHPRSPAATWARVGKGTALLQAEDAEGAIEQFEAVLADTDAVVLRWRALEGLAFAHELREDWDAAAEQFQAMEALDDERIRLQARYHQARLTRLRGDDQGALEALQEVRQTLRDEDAPDLPYLAEQVDQLIRRIDPTAIPAASGAQPELSPQEMQELMRRLQQEGGAGGGLE